MLSYDLRNEKTFLHYQNNKQTTNNEKVEAAIVSSTRASSADYKVHSEKINSAEFTGINRRKSDDWN